MRRIEIDEDKCKCLALCAQVCPEECLDFDLKRKKAFVSNEFPCFACRNCEQICPFNAIKINEEVGPKL